MQYKTNQDIDATLQQFLQQDGPCVCEVFTDPEEFHEPKVVAKIGTDGKIYSRWIKIIIQWIN